MTDGHAGEYGDGSSGSLVGLLAEQRDLYAQLAALADHQRALISDDDPERLLGVLGQRQGLIDRLGALGERLRPLQQDWRRTRAALPENEGQQVDDLVAETNRLLSGILENDAADARALSERKQEASAQLGGVRKTRAMGAAYAAADGARDSHVDWTDE
jgi:hypothetical protein